MNTETEICVLCCRKIDIYAFGNCFHAVCHECCTRIRVLCAKTDCTICRQALPEVIFSTKLYPFEKFDLKGKEKNKEYGIIFDTPKTESGFYKLLEHPCNVCKDKHFPNFMQLKDHMRRIHDKFYCNLCVDNTKLFSFERQVYSRSELVHHRQYGDSDNTSLRAHPLCKFCNERYMDEDELYRHLRKDHFFCHFCDADGRHVFYCDYPGLREHFKIEHCLCEEGDCVNEQFTSAFRSDIDLKAHKASVHNKYLSKAKAKQARTIDVNFLLTPRPKRNHYYMDESDKSSQKTRNTNENASDKDVVASEKLSSADLKPQTTKPFDAKDFPTLDNNDSSKVESGFRPTMWQGAKKQPSVSVENDFPSLSSISSFTTSNWVIGNSNTVTSDSSKNKTSKINNAQHVVKKRADVNDQNEFPSLTPGAPVVTSTNWVVPQTNTKTETAAKTTSKKEKNNILPIKSHNDFPTLTKLSDNKTSSVKAQITEKAKPLQKKNLNQNKQSTSNPKTFNDMKKQEENKNLTDISYDSLADQNFYEVLDMNGFDEVAPSVSVKKKLEPVSFKDDDFPELAKKLTTISNVKPTVVVQPKLKPKLREKNKLLKSFPKVSLKDDSFSLQGLADSLKATNASKKKNPKKNPVDENKTTNEIIIENDENNSGKKKSNGRINKTNSITQPTEFCTLDTKFDKMCEYIPPDNFQQRNFDLINKIQVMFNNSDSSFGDFKTVSGQFRQNEIAADRYYEQCMNLLGNNEFFHVFPELIVLLPDIKKQQELLLVNKRLQKSSKPGLDIKVKVCDVCQQVVAKQDFAVHKLRHT